MATQTKLSLISACGISLLLFISVSLARSDEKSISYSLVHPPSYLNNLGENVVFEIINNGQAEFAAAIAERDKRAIRSFIASITNTLHNHFSISWTYTNALTTKLVMLICHILPEIALIT